MLPRVTAADRFGHPAGGSDSDHDLENPLLVACYIYTWIVFVTRRRVSPRWQAGAASQGG
jgi:hypothetical protein